MHTDYEVGRVLAKLDALDESGQTDNAQVDNGASMEGMLSGSFTDIAGEEGVKQDPSFVLAHICIAGFASLVGSAASLLLAPQVSDALEYLNYAPLCDKRRPSHSLSSRPAVPRGINAGLVRNIVTVLFQPTHCRRLGKQLPHHGLLQRNLGG
jgi:hypothetical protein